MTYKQAIKLPKGGAVAMNDFNLQAQAASVIAGRHGFRPEKVYEWANNHSHELTRMGHILSDPKVNSDLFEAIIDDKPFINSLTMEIKIIGGNVHIIIPLQVFEDLIDPKN